MELNIEQMAEVIAQELGLEGFKDRAEKESFVRAVKLTLQQVVEMFDTVNDSWWRTRGTLRELVESPLADRYQILIEQLREAAK